MRSWVALLLPVFLWRALIPIGFMPMIGMDHSVRLVICDSYAPLPAGVMDMTMHAGMDMSRGAGGDSTGSPPVHQDHGGCLYGSSPALGALPAATISPLLFDKPAHYTVAAPRTGFLQSTSRAHSARAPPA
jgi:hypothetical protein